MNTLELHVISNGWKTLDTLLGIGKAVVSSVDRLHLREKKKAPEEMAGAVEALIRGGIPREKLVINDRADIAWCYELAGVQLPANGLPADKVKKRFPGLTVGCSVHSIAEAKEKEAAGADYLLYGNVFPTPSKPGKPGAGLAQLEALVSRVSIPVIAIGGIVPENVRAIRSTGAAGIAVMSGIWNADDPKSNAERYAGLLKRG